jgi:hypothetical protein
MNNNYNIFYYLHILICLTVLSIPLWEKNYLKIGIYIPFCISLIWIIFEDCPLSKLHNMDKESFSMSIYKNIIPNISEKTNHNINTCILLGVTLLCYDRLLL